MITIVLHEIEENIKSLRFLLMVLFSILLFTVNGLLFVPRINDRINSYSGCINNTKNRSTVVTTIHKKPSLLLFIADGEDKYGEDQYLLYPGMLNRITEVLSIIIIKCLIPLILTGFLS